MATRRPRAAPTGTTPPADPPLFPEAVVEQTAATIAAVWMPDPSSEPIASPPAKLSKLSVAMQSVTKNVEAIQALDAAIAEVERNYPAGHVFAVATKDGYKQADRVRSEARRSRLHVAEMRKQGTDLLNGLKGELWAVADPQMARLQAIEDNAKGQIAAHDAKEAARKARHEDAIAAISLLGTGASTMTSHDLAVRRSSVAAIVIDNSYEEYEERAKHIHADVTAVLEHAHAAALVREAAEASAHAEKLRDVAARERIAFYKNLPQALADHTSAQIAAGIADLPASDDDEAIYGSLAEFVSMARDKAASVLEGMHKAAVLNEEAAAAPHVQDEPHPFEPTFEQFVADVEAINPGPDGEPQAPDANGDLDLGLALIEADRKWGDGPARTAPEEEDPFSVEAMQRKARESTPSLSLPSPAPVAEPPKPRGRTAIPAPAIQAAESGAALYTVARRVRAAYVVLSDAEAATLPGVLRAALEELKRTVH